MREPSSAENERSQHRPRIRLGLAVMGLAAALAVSHASCRRAPPDWSVTGSPRNSPLEVPAAGRDLDSDESESDAETSPAEKTVAPAGKQKTPHSLEGPPGTKPQGKTSPNKNPLAGCDLCHVDVEDEFIGSIHFKKKVGCQDCHGPSDGHIADENNDVKPDVLFVRKNADRLCGKCHDCTRPVVAKLPRPTKVLARVCTDCHGSHSIAMTQKKPPSPQEVP